MTARFGTSVMFFVNGALFATWVSRIPDVKTDLQIGDARLGLALFSLGLGTFLALPLTRAFIRRYGAAQVTRASALSCCAALAAAGAASSLPFLLLALPLFGASLGVMDVAMNSQASRLEQTMGRSIMASFHGLWSLGALTGALLGVAFASQGAPRLFHCAAVALFLAAVAQWGAPRVEGVAPSSAPVSLASLPRAALGIGVVAACGAIVEGGIAEWSAVFLRDELGTGAGFAPVGFAAFSLTMMIGRFTGDRLIDALGRATVLRGGALVTAAAVGGALLTAQPWVAVAAFALAGLGVATVFPIAFSSAGRHEGAAPGAAIATVAAMGYGGGLTGPPLIGFLAEVSSLTLALWTLVALSLVMAALAFLVAEKRGASAMLLDAGRP
jgi:fucose permease